MTNLTVKVCIFKIKTTQFNPTLAAVRRGWNKCATSIRLISISELHLLTKRATNWMKGVKITFWKCFFSATIQLFVETSVARPSDKASKKVCWVSMESNDFVLTKLERYIIIAFGDDCLLM